MTARAGRRCGNNSRKPSKRKRVTSGAGSNNARTPDAPRGQVFRPVQRPRRAHRRGQPRARVDDRHVQRAGGARAAHRRRGAHRRQDHPRDHYAAAQDIHHAVRPRPHPPADHLHGRHPRPDPGRRRVGRALRPAQRHAGGEAARRDLPVELRPGQDHGRAAQQREAVRRHPQVLRGNRPPRVRRRPRDALGDGDAVPRGERPQAPDQAARDLRPAGVDHRPLRGRREHRRRHRSRELLMAGGAAQISLGVVLGLVLVALAFDFLNGFHDAANSIATVVSTRVLKPYQAVLLAAFFNFAALFVFAPNVATTVGKGIVDQGIVDQYVVLGALIGAIAWDLITWWYGIPSSSSHALVGGLVGAAVAKAGTWALIAPGIIKIVLFIFISPALGFAIAALLMLAVAWAFRRSSPSRVDRWFRRLQLVSASFYSLGHGGNDAQKTAGIIWMLLIVSGHLHPREPIPNWVISICYITIGLGTAFGGWRIVKTMGQRITKLRPVGGFRGLSTPVLSVDRHGIQRVKRFPCDALRIDGPVFVAPGVAARRTLLLHSRHVGLRKPHAKVLQLDAVFRLDAEMVDTALLCPGGNREVYARIIELPLCVVVFLNRGLSREQRGVKANALC